MSQSSTAQMNLSFIPVVWLLPFLLPFLFLAQYLLYGKHKAPLPPGPKGRYPLLGMTFDIPKRRPWLALKEMADKYGPIMHLKIGLQHHIYISDGQVMHDLLGSRGNIYSSRPPSVVGHILSENMRSLLMPYGASWRSARKNFANLLTAKKCDTYVQIQEKEAIVTLDDIAAVPDRFKQHLHRYTLSVASTVAYGKRVPRWDDPFAQQVTQMMHNFTGALLPGKYLVDTVPAIQYLPRPLKPWMEELEEFRDLENSLTLQYYREAVQSTEKDAQSSFAKGVESMCEAEGLSELQAATTCMEILGAGSDTTANAIYAAIHACLLNPEVIIKAQEELDRVIGQDRFVTWADEPNLPYMRGIIKEQHRWRTISPQGISHYSTEEDVYRGYRIPKGSVIHVMMWAIHMDPNRYPDPTKFQPERFLDHPLSAAAYANGSDMVGRDHFSYGNGKRICPGLHLAERSLFNMTARLLQTFIIKPALDTQGEEIPMDPDAYTTGMLSAPEPYKARFIVRCEKLKALLERERGRMFQE